jgi:hypothetical protein
MAAAAAARRPSEEEGFFFFALLYIASRAPHSFSCLKKRTIEQKRKKELDLQV